MNHHAWAPRKDQFHRRKIASNNQVLNPSMVPTTSYNTTGFSESSEARLLRRNIAGHSGVTRCVCIALIIQTVTGDNMRRIYTQNEVIQPLFAQILSIYIYLYASHKT